MTEERISKKELMKMYGVDRSTIENWIKFRGLPLIEVSSHSKFISRKNLHIWEQQLIQNKNKLKDL